MSAQHGHYTPEKHEHADDWHHHGSEEGVPQAEHAGIVNPFTVGKWFILIVVSVIATVAVLYLYFTHYTTQQKAKFIETVSWSAEAAAYKARMEGELTGKAEWLDHERIRIPVSDAMSKVVKEYGKQTSEASGK